VEDGMIWWILGVGLLLVVGGIAFFLLLKYDSAPAPAWFYSSMETPPAQMKAWLRQIGQKRQEDQHPITTNVA
jgi:hypothetical protein